ncbi:DUF6127 family protein [Sphingomicrobium arenosum]|uniref:DUF6127 family protein n=1 Tax=Sphingomicrobium arenosum TaxID=2233861 RepID=UPI00223FCA37|nr:DUF6127 family protein [Sphingomicrobium arenosum]
MSDARVIGALAAMAEQGGLDRLTLAALIEESSARGARDAMARLGLEDRSARRDMDDLRELLGAWRAAKKSATHALIGWLSKAVLALCVAGAAWQLGLLAGTIAK